MFAAQLNKLLFFVVNPDSYRDYYWASVASHSCTTTILFNTFTQKR